MTRAEFATALMLDDERYNFGFGEKVLPISFGKNYARLRLYPGYFVITDYAREFLKIPYSMVTAVDAAPRTSITLTGDFTLSFIRKDYT